MKSRFIFLVIILLLLTVVHFSAKAQSPSDKKGLYIPHRFKQSSKFKQTTPQVYPHAFQKKDILMNLSLSLGTRKQELPSGIYRRGTFPPISFSAEYGLTNFLSLGPYLSFSPRGFKFEDKTHSDAFQSHLYYAGLKASLHFAPMIEKLINQNLDSEHLDLYLAFSGGYKGTLFGRKFPTGTDEFTGSGMLGMRYFLGEHFGLFAECGYGPFEVLLVGASLRF